MDGGSIGHRPKGAWKFDAGVADVFEDMLMNSIPLYQQTLDLICDLFLDHIKGIPRHEEPIRILTLGVGTGVGLQYIYSRLSASVQVGHISCVDSSPDMISAALENIGGRSKIEVAELICSNLDDSNEHSIWSGNGPFDLVLYQWTSQFVSPECRSDVIASIPIRDDGLLFFSDKTRGENSYEEGAYRSRYHSWKRRMGYSDEDVREKSLSLRRVLMPMTENEIRTMLEGEGYSVLPIARYLQFASWVCRKT